MANRERTDTPGFTRRDPYRSSGNWLDPSTQFRRLADQMDRWFDTFGMGRTASRMPARSESSWGMDLWAPEMETFMRDDQFVIRMDVPGINKDDVNVELTEDSVVIHGERQNAHEEEREGYYRSERTYGRFFREVPLPDGAQPDTAKANYRDGVLEITVTAPVRQTSRPRRIDIGSAPTSERERGPRESSQRQPSVAHDRGRGESER